MPGLFQAVISPHFLVEVSRNSRMIGPTPVFMRFLRRKRHSGGLHPVGEQQNQPFQLSFNPSLKVDFQGSRVTSDGGLLLVRS